MALDVAVCFFLEGCSALLQYEMVINKEGKGVKQMW